MTLFKSEHRSPRHISMTGELKSSRPKAGAKRPSGVMYGSDYHLEYDCYQDDFYDRVYEYQRVPASVAPVPHGPGLAKRPRSSSSSSLRHTRDRALTKSSGRPANSSSSRAKLKMEELQTIKRELTLIKVQIDGLLESLDRMDRQRRDRSGSPPTREGSLTGSPYHGLSTSPEASPRTHSPQPRARRDREGGASPELGEASDDDLHTMNNHSSDLEEDM